MIEFLNKTFASSKNVLTHLLRNGGSFLLDNRNTITVLALLYLVLQAAAEEYMLIDPDGDKTTLVCFLDDKLGKLGLRFLDYNNGQDGLYYNLWVYNKNLNCGIENDSMTKSQMIDCLRKGLNLFGVFQNGESHPLVQEVDFEKTCRPLFDRMLHR